MICTPKVGQTFGGAYHFRCFIFDKRVFLHHLICRHTAFRTKRNFPADQRTTLLTFFHLRYLHKNKSESASNPLFYGITIPYLTLQSIRVFVPFIRLIILSVLLSASVFFISTKFFFRHILYFCKNTKLLTKRILSIIINTIRN